METSKSLAKPALAKYSYLGCLLWLLIIPLLYALMTYLLDEYNNANEAASLSKDLYQIQSYFYWLSIGIGHIFFIGTIVKSFSKKQETITDEQATGLLDEFAE